MSQFKVVADGTQGWLVKDEQGRSIRAGDGPWPGWHRGVGLRNQDDAENLAAALSAGRLTAGETDEGSPFIDGGDLNAWTKAQGWD